MAEINKLSVEKALEKLRSSDRPNSEKTRIDRQMEALDEKTKRMRRERLRLDRLKKNKD